MSNLNNFAFNKSRITSSQKLKLISVFKIVDMRFLVFYIELKVS